MQTHYLFKCIFICVDKHVQITHVDINTITHFAGGDVLTHTMTGVVAQLLLPRQGPFSANRAVAQGVLSRPR